MKICKKMKILAIDDNKDNIVVLEALIRESFPDAKYISSLSGRRGFEMCLSERPDLVLLDIVMPEMDGFEVCRKIKSDPSVSIIPVLMITADRTGKESRITALEAGADGFLAKPVDKYELKAQIKAMFRLKEAEDHKLSEKQQLEELVRERTLALQTELADRIKAEDKLVESLDKLNKNRRAILNLMEDLKAEMNERKEIESRLKDEKNLLRTLVDNLPDPIYILDTEGRKIMANRADYLNIGLNSENEVLGKNDLQLFPGDVGERGHSDNMLVINSEKPIIDKEEFFYDRNGDLLWLLTSKYPLYDSQGKLTGLFGTGHNITDRKKWEQELVSAKEKAVEGDRLKTAFLHNVSHEIRTPLNAIMGFTTLLNEPDVEKDLRSSYIEVIMSSSEQLLAVVSDILEISNIEAGIMKLNIEEIDLDRQLNLILKQYMKRASDKGIGLSLKIPEVAGKLHLRTDPPKFKVLITNLINNALKFTHQGRIEFGYSLKDGEINFFVSDTGIGISKEEQIKIFNRFYQVDHVISRSYEGTGLGLSICKAYAGFMGGRIWVDSEPGRGSVFQFTLPPDAYYTVEEVAVTDNSKKDFIPKDTHRILVAEDEEYNFRVVREYLTRGKFQVIRAYNGKEAVDIVAAGTAIDLILMDIKMPVMDGYEATRQIKKIKKELPVLALTAFVYGSDREKCFSAGCDDFITKPVKMEYLINIVSKYLKKKT